MKDFSSVIVLLGIFFGVLVIQSPEAAGMIVFGFVLSIAGGFALLWLFIKTLRCLRPRVSLPEYDPQANEDKTDYRKFVKSIFDKR